MDYIFILKSIILQVSLFSAVPFFYWLIRKRKQNTFLSYVGIVKPQMTTSVRAVIIFSLGYILVYGLVHFTPIAALTQPSANTYAGLRLEAVVPGLLVCFIQQGLAEEILFRGFIGKRFISKMGFQWGNILQAIVFSVIHVLLSISADKKMISYLIIFTSIAAGGWLLGYLDEKLFKGSIIPSILLHGLGNFIMIMSVAY